MRHIASLALAFALFAAPAALAADCAGHAAKASCCSKKEGAASADKKCDPATCKEGKDCTKCTPEQKAKCCASGDKKAEAPKPAKG
jgi:hypothetical protein